MGFFDCPPEVVKNFKSCALTNEEYRQLQEVAYVNDTGSTQADFANLLLTIATTVLLANSTPYHKVSCQFLVEYATIILPSIIFCFSSQYIPYCAVFALGMYVLYGEKRRKKTESSLDQTGPGQLNFITYYRTIIMIITCIAIHAVDFLAFPRRFAKSTNTGLSIMDIGVSTLVFSSGVVSLDARSAYSSGAIKSNWSFKKVISSVMPLVILGFSRLVFVVVSGHYVPITEYGSHWNFFFTLAFITLVSSFFTVLLDPRFHFIFGIPLIFLAKPFGEIGSSNPDGFWEKNKIGLSNCIAMLAIYSFGVSFGASIFSVLSSYHKEEKSTYSTDSISEGKRRKSGSTRMKINNAASIEFLDNSKEKKNKLLYIGLFAFLVAAGVYLTFQKFSSLPAKRSEANFSFIIQHTAVAFCALALIIVVSHFSFLHKSESRYSALPLILQGMHKNQLTIFLLANIITGIIVNGMRPLIRSPAFAYTVLISYTLLLFGLAYIMGKRNVKTKIW